MTDKHTKGPWKVCSNTAGKWINPANKVDPNSSICECYFYRTHEETDANEKLIAAAPEMLEALNNVQNLIVECVKDGFIDKDNLNALFLSQQTTAAAIAKAKGLDG